MRQPRLLSPGIMRWLLTLSVNPTRRNGTRSGIAARGYGFTEDEVQVHRSGRLMPLSKARKQFGDEWMGKVSFTGREMLTKKGSTALSTGRRPA